MTEIDIMDLIEPNYYKQTLSACKGPPSIPRFSFFDHWNLRFELPPELIPKPVHQKYSWKPPCYHNKHMKKNSADMKYMRAPNHSKPMKK
jgi:hypothetical protein